MNPSTAQGQVLVDELIRCGVADVVLAPGSRSAPLALALASAEERGLLRLHIRIDERSAGFLAVGLAQVSHRAVVVVTTSGTAVSNLTPAMVEASYAGLPVVAITADRPSELRDTGANQTIDQARAFGTAARWFHELGVAQPLGGQVGYWRSIISRAIDVAIEGGDPGPVHLNVPLRSPLVPDGDDTWPEPLGLIPTDFDLSDLPDLMPHTVDGRLALSAAQPLDEVLGPFVGGALDLAELFDALADDDDEDDEDDDGDADDDDEYDPDAGMPALSVVPARGVVVVGHCTDVEQGDAAIALAEACGWPLLAEPTGNARSGDTTLTHGPILLADKDFLDNHIPEIAIVVGSVGLSRSVLELIRRTPLVVGVDSRAAVRRSDPTRTTTVYVAVVPEPPDEYDAYDDTWLDSWLSADAQARAAVERTLDGAETLTGPDVARTVWDVLGPDHLLLVAASWPVRYLESFARVRETADAPTVVGNRGTSGIDGLVSTAWGAAVAHQSEQTAVLEDSAGDLSMVTSRGATAYALLGDLAFLHDHNGLLAPAEETRPDLVYVVVDNDGGGIFSQLEQADAPHFERVFGTPHGLDLVAIAAATGVPAERVTNVGALVRALDTATAAGGIHVIVAKVGSRQSEAALLADVQQAVSAALREAASAD